MKKKTLYLSLLCVMNIYAYDGVELSRFNTPLPAKSDLREKKCWKICKKRVEKVELMQKAIEFYKKERRYSSPSSSLMKRSR